MRKFLQIFVIALVLLPLNKAFATVFTVTNTSDNNTSTGANQGDLRWCINQATSTGGPHTINFAIPGPVPAGGYVITINGSYILNNQVITINATTQPGWVAGQPVVVIRGQNTGFTAFNVQGSTQTIRGLIIQNVQRGIEITGGSNHVVTGCWFGIDYSGNTEASASINDVGIHLSNVTGTTIGGLTLAERNVISGCLNTNDGARKGAINITSGSTNTTVRGNIIGLNSTGTSSANLGNGNSNPLTQHGIYITGNSSTVANPVTIDLNVISNNIGNGIWSDGGGNGVRITGNVIGMNLNDLPAGNKAGGIRIDGGSNHVIGGTTAAARNIISGNGGAPDSRPCRADYCGAPSGDAHLYDGTLQCGIYFAGVTNSTIAGNYIGTTGTGNTIIVPTSFTPYNGSGNLYAGIKMEFASTGNIIGGSVAGANVIGGNGFDSFVDTDGVPTDEPAYLGHGIQLNLAAVNSNTISFNNVGVGADGTSAVGNRQDGVSLLGAKTNIISNNNIANNTWGIFLQSDFSSGAGSGQPTGNTISNNIVTNNGNRTTPVLHTDGGGIGLQHGAASNTISGNTVNDNRNGLVIRNEGAFGGPPSNNTTTSNTINSNDAAGVKISHGALSNTLTSNTISANGTFGIELDNAQSNIFRTNTITNNTSDGINLYNGSKGNIIGGTLVQGNTITGNGGNGVQITNPNAATTNNNPIQGNTFSCNGARGIELNGAGNGNYAKPVLVDNGNGTFNVTGTGYIQLYTIDGCNTCAVGPSNGLEGMTVVFEGTAPITNYAPAGGRTIADYTATASTGAPGTTNNNTSEFSFCCSPAPVSINTSKTTYCQSETATFTSSLGAIAGNIYAWTITNTSGTLSASITNQGTSSISVTFTGSGTARVDLTQTGICGPSVATSVNITVNPPPPAPTVGASGPVSFCQGGSVTLSVTSPTAGLTFQWFRDGVSAGTGTSIIASTSGAYTVIATSASSCPSTASAAVNVTVNPTPPTPTIAAAGPTTFCQGGSVTINVSSATAGLTFQWFRDGVAAGTGTSIVATTSGAYTVVATSASSCPSAASAAVNVTVNPTPPTPTIAAAGSTTFCQGGSVTINVNSATAGLTFQWFRDGVAAGTGTSIVATTSGAYTVVATSASSCPSAASAAVNVTVNPTPPTPTIAAAGPTTFCQGGSVTINVTSSTTGFTFEWFQGATSVGTGTSITVSTAGTYTVIPTSTATCVGPASSGVSIIVNPIPTPSIGGSSFSQCSNTSGINYTTNLNTGSTYIWSATPGVSVTSSSLNNATISVAATAGTLTVEETRNGCTGTDTRTITISPSLNPSIVGNLTPCENTNGIVYTASGNPGSNYSWNVTGQDITTTGSSIGNQITINVGVFNGQLTINEESATCSGSTTVDIIVIPRPVVNPSAQAPEICIGESTTLNANVTGSATGPYTYVWTPNTDLVPADGANPVVTPTTEGDHTYSLTVTSNNTCSNATPATVTVKVKPRPIVTPTANAGAICLGESTTLHANVTGTATGPYTYAWTPNTDLVPVDGSDPVATPTTVGDHTYSLTVTAANACGNATPATVMVTVKPRPIVTPTADAGSICIGESTTLHANVTGTATGPFTYAWTPNTDLVPADGSDPVATPTTEGDHTYSLTVTAANACGNATPATVMVTVKPRPIVTPTADAGSICIGESTTLHANVTGTATGPFTYAWAPNTDLVPVDGADPVATPTTVGDHIYSLTVTAANACGNATPATVTVTVKPRPIVNATADAGSICIGESTTLHANVTGTGPYTYAWTPNTDLVPVDGSDPVATPTTVGDHTYSLTVTAANACGNATPATVMVTVKPRPIVTPTADAGSICIGESTTLHANVTGTATGPFTYVWTPNTDLVPADGSDPVATPTTEGDHTYSLTVTAANACGNATPATVMVTVKPRPIVDATSDNSAICIGGSTTLHAAITGSTGPFTYVWTPNTDLVPANGADPVVTPTTEGLHTYTLVVTGSNSCGNATPAQVTVRVDGIPGPADAGSNTPVPFCGQNAVYTMSGNTPTPASAVGTWYVYTGAGDFENNDIHNPVVKVGNMALGENRFVWSVVNGACPATTDTITIINNTPDANIAAASTGPCLGTTSKISAVGTGGTIQWSGAPGVPAGILDDYTILEPTINTSTPGGPWKLYLTITGGCPAVDSIMVSVHSNPTATLVAPTDTICAGNEVDLLASSVLGGTAPYVYYWSNADLTLKDSTYSVNPDATLKLKPANEGEVVYQVMIKDGNGCYSPVAKDTVQIYKEQPLFIPSLITPNADDMNDCFMILDATKQYDILPGAKFQLYNRWGQPVYRSDKYRNGDWCGSDLADGVYFYHLDTGCGNKELKGWLQIMSNEANNE